MPILSDAEIAELETLLVDLGFPDECHVVRTVSGGTDEFGNTLPASAAVVEVSACLLRAGGLQPQEQVIADRLGWTVPYVIELRKATLLTPNDRIRVNGNREFEVGGVTKEGRFGVGSIAIVNEAG